MKKVIFYTFTTVTIAFIITLSSWFTWGSSCIDFYKAWSQIEGGNTSYNGMCSGDGAQFIGVFFFAFILSVILMIIFKLALKLLHLKIADK